MGSVGVGNPCGSWCEPPVLLHSLYSSHYARASYAQSVPHIKGLCGLLQRFTEEALQRSGEPDSSDGMELDIPDASDDSTATAAAASTSPSLISLQPRDARALHTAVTALQSDLTVTWYPEFGCALLALGLPDQDQDAAAATVTCATSSSRGSGGGDYRPRPGLLELHVVGLDDWGFHVHSTPTSMEHTATCKGYRTLACGSVTTDALPDLRKHIVALISAAREERSEKNVHNGFQHTPAFIHAATKTALTDLSAGGGSGEAAHRERKVEPRGGFSDVGQHTGGDTVRDTCWPLVQEVLQELLRHDAAVTSSSRLLPRQRQQPRTPPSLLLRQALALLDLWLLGRQLPLLTPATATPTMITALTQMLGAATAKAAALSDSGYDMSAFEAACGEVEQRISTVTAQRALAVAKVLELPDAASPGFRGAAQAPCGVLPEPVVSRVEGDGLAAAQQRSERNLGSLPLLSEGASFGQVLTAMSQAPWAQPGSDVAAQLVLRSVERELFTCAVAGFDAPANQLSGEEVSALEKVVDAYRSAVQRYLATPLSEAAMRVELRSREVLVVWVAYCLIHTAAGRTHPLVRQYGVLGPYHCLRHLVLSDRKAVDAALSVATYLRMRAVPGRWLFSLHDDGAGTMNMAQEYARSCPLLPYIWELEQKDAATRVQEHWKEVQRKQRLARELRSKLSALQSEAVSLQATVRSCQADYDRERSPYSSHNVQQASDSLQSARANVNYNDSKQRQTEAELREAEKAPPPVIQPLPTSSQEAYKWLFFLHMPPLLRALSRSSFLAQQMLLPRPCSAEVAQAIAEKFTTSLTGHYNSQRAVRTYNPSPVQTLHVGSDGAVKLWSRGSVPQPSNVGPHQIDTFYSESQGVWYPDSLGPCMAWSGSGAKVEAAEGFPAFFNPFAPGVGEKLVEEWFTESLPGEAVALQWAMHLRGTAAATPADRGSLAIAQQDTRPGWLSKPAFLEFGTLRAFPLRQLRRLAAALHDRTLPPAHPAVRTLVLQTLYQVGTLTDTDPPGLLWRTDWDREGDVLQTLCFELGTLAEELKDTPRAHEAVLLLGPMAAYLADWHGSCADVARRFAAMTCRVADEMEPQIVAVSNDDRKREELLAKQCKWRCMALLCYGAGPLTEEDVGHMVELMVLVAQGQVFLQDLKLREELGHLIVQVHNVMADRVAQVVSAVQQRPQLLTRAVARVMERTPDHLAWSRLGSAASFEAVCSAGHLYSINLLDGTVLFDGWPPSRLPKEVTDHPLYRRTFGDWNFEVARSEDGLMKGLRTVNNRLYDFRISADGRQLMVTEVDSEHGGVALELLDAGEDWACGQWGRGLPVCLRELYSHWLCREHGVMVLRRPSFQEHSPHFIMVRTPHVYDNKWHCSYDCRRVPPHLRSHHWLLLCNDHWRELTDQLVLLSGSTVKDTILAKFEDPRFIHVYRNLATHNDVGGQSEMATEEGEDEREHQADEDGELLLFELSRYGLEFCLRGGQVLSKDYRGYRLHRSQQLVMQHQQPPAGAQKEDEGEGEAAGGGTSSSSEALYTLPEFRQYLMLERVPGSGAVLGARRADELVLVPAGGVAVVGGGWGTDGGDWVQVQRSEESGAHLKAHCYEVHGRFGHLRAPSILARLQLAALYAASSTLLPEPLSRCTGAQTAMELLRQCWGTRPLSTEELVQLRSVGRLGGHLAPGLNLLAHEVEASAAQLSHLHAAVATPAAKKAAAGGGSGGGAVMPCLDTDAGIRYEQLLEGGGSGGGRGGGASGGLGSSSCGGGSGTTWPVNPRLLLTVGEEVRVGMVGRSEREDPEWLRRRHYTPIQMAEPFPVSPEFVPRVEQQLCDLVVVVSSGTPWGRSAVPPYPLAAAGAGGVPGPVGATPLERAMHQELADSWAAHHSLPAVEQQRVAPTAVQDIKALKASVQQHRQAAESYLLRSLTTVPATVGVHGTSFRLLRLSGAAPTAGLLDLARAALQPETLLQFNPFLSGEAVKALRAGVLTWLQLCVLEDRLVRLERLAAAGEPYRIALIQELLVRRTWDPSQHPQWLVFEAEGQLQIRPGQYTVAAHLMSHPGAIAQLNMGEGKTRVILPMLVLHWADGSRVVRLNFLSTLLDEAYSHLHLHLTAGLLGRKLFTLPFRRDVEVAEGGARAMLASLRHCMREGGALLVAPEHRLSLHLKRLELMGASKTTAAGGPGQGEREQRPAACGALLGAVLTGLPYLDLLDESDELLHHRFQLVYACGSSTALPALHERCGAAQALLRIASCLAAQHRQTHHQHHSQQGPLLPSGAAVLEAPAGASPGAFCGLRLLPGEALSAALPGLHRRLAEELLAHPPYELRWLAQHPLRDRILACITDDSHPADHLLLGGGGGGPAGAGQQLADDQVATVLALRGLLGCHLMAHCLQKRHRVDYGVSRLDTARKRLAVPFRAARTPSERSEFAQPDVALLLTHLSYYYDGLSYDEFLAALRVLLSMGENAQRAFYGEWLELSEPDIPQEEYTEMDTVRKVDPTNSQQVSRLHRYFSHNMAVVDFWLSHCVLPSETRQFPQRLAASSWHLADNPSGPGQVVGFSGTNDNHRLLPLQVHQADVGDPGLRATNGKMLHVILQTTRGYSTLAVAEAAGKPVWQALLDSAREGGHHALLDCGALLAGASNRDAANYLREHLDRSRHQGVTYFDEDLRTWVVTDLRGRVTPRHSSPIAERDTFVIYDEARCRGADLQLQPGAVGLLTMGPGVCKDKLMQAAGRLRQLGRGQELWLAATPDITAKIRQLSNPLHEPTDRVFTSTTTATTSPAAAFDGLATVLHWASRGLVAEPSGARSRRTASPAEPTALQVLCWVMQNTVDATLKGVLQWSAQGLHFAATKGVPERVRQDEVLELSQLYGNSKTVRPVAEVVTARFEHQVSYCEENGGLAADMLGLMERIVANGVSYGEGHEVTTGGGGGADDEECERELEEEEEEEQEAERQVPRVKPAQERDWSYTTALAAASTAQLDAGAGVVLLLAAVTRHLLPRSLHSIPWSGRVWCTSNFLNTITAQKFGAAVNEYLRPVEALLLFPASGEVLLVSEREADQLLLLAWGTRVNATRVNGQALISPGAHSDEAPVLMSLCYARLAVSSSRGFGNNQDAAAPRLATHLQTGVGATPFTGGAAAGAVSSSGALITPRVSELVSVQLFNGEAAYESEEQWGALRGLVAQRREDAEALVDMRGKGPSLARSDLERACGD